MKGPFSNAKTDWAADRRGKCVGFGLAFAALIWLAAPARAEPATDEGGDLPAQSEAAELARQYVEDFMLRERLNAESAFLTEEIERLELIGQAGSPGRSLLAELELSTQATRQALVDVLQANARPLVQDLELASAESGEQIDELRTAWEKIRTDLNQDRFLLFEVKASRRVAGQLASLLSVDKRWFWFFGVVAMAVLLGVVLHDRRHEIRRLLNGGRARAMKLSKFLTVALVVLAAITLATFVMGQRIYESLLAVGSGEETSPRRAIDRQNASLKAEIEELRQSHEESTGRCAEAETQWRETLTASLPPGKKLPWQWKEFRTEILEIAVQASLLESLPQAIRADVEELQRVNEELGTHTEAKARYLALKGWIRGGLGLALVGLTATGGFLFWRGVRSRRETTANTCPLCLGVDKLSRISFNGSETADARSPERGVLQCKNVISRQPYEECDYTFMEAYRTMGKLCIPTLGIPQAGKTHWLAMLYWELNRGNYPDAVQFEKIKSQSSEDFDLIVEEILNARIGTAATQRERIPHPIVFDFQDQDRLGRSNVLVNIFDYSGEVTSDMGVEDHRRRRALDGDGFLFFLDPTYPAEPQAKALADFREDLRLIKGIKAGKRTRTPVAICVSKIDMMAGQSYAMPGGGDAIEEFYRELAAIDPTGEGMTSKIIAGRSRALARLRETIWPGWQIERQIDDLFGGRYLFFPLTPVGLDGLGETDLSLRTISPFGLLEPLVWLLQMNGYPILE
ncbi:MAG TPA: hypothetical protein VMY42_25755 [Thermoguttaceae bacterium]|nr:hypothetical protein [Thermoguttaceae bacterium]